MKKTLNGLFLFSLSAAVVASLVCVVRADSAVQPTLTDGLNSVKQTASDTGQQIKTSAVQTGQAIKTNAAAKAKAKKDQIKQKMSSGPTLQQREAAAKAAAAQKTNDVTQKASDTANQGINNATSKLDNSLKGLGGN